MAETAETRTPDTGNWIHGCFLVTVGTDYTTYKDVFRTYSDIVKYASEDDSFTNGGAKLGAPALDPNIKKILDGGTDNEKGTIPIYFSKRKCRDSSLGGNDAINPLPQFSVDDDISHPHYYVDTKGEVAMGQVYSENYDDFQQILYLGFGIPVFANVGNFWTNAVDQNLADFVNKGTGITAEKIGYLLGSAPMRVYQIATVPFKFLAALTNSLQNVPISQYYSFSSQMPMYFRFVNTILIRLATNMNMAGSLQSVPSTGSVTSDTTAVAQVTGGTKAGEDLSGLSTAFRDHGLDMARIMVKRYKYEMGNAGIAGKRFTDEALTNSINANNGQGTTAENNATQSTQPTDPSVASEFKTWTMSLFDNFRAAYNDGLYDGHLFIGFRIDKGMGGSESFSNATGESQISQTANERFMAGREAAFQAQNGEFGTGAAGGAMSWVSGLVTGAVKSISNMVGMDPLVAAGTGAARITIPDVWMNSTWNRTASFTITCLAPYGDFESILASEYVPLACMLAGTLPRGTGYSSHSSPFVCQAYCRGVFSSPLCIIENLEVVRGADQFGMTAARLPLKLTMHVTLKDLSPAMYMNMGGTGGILQALIGTDDNFGEYMMTLSGMGLRDRLNPYRNIRRKVDILMSTLFKNKLNPYMLGMDGADRFLISRVISRISGVSGRGLPGS